MKVIIIQIIADFDFSHKFHERAVTVPKSEYKWVFNNDAQEKFKNETTEGGFADIWDDQNVETELLYSRWKNKLTETLNKTTTKIYENINRIAKGNNKGKVCTNPLRLRKRNLKRKLSKGINQKNRTYEKFLKLKLQIMNKKIRQVTSKENKAQILKQLEKLKNFSVNSTEFFKLRNKILGYKPTIASSVMTEEGKECVDSASIMKECQKYFSTLLTNRIPSKKCRGFHKTIEKTFEKLISIQGQKRYATDCPFSLGELEKAIKSFKKKKSPGMDNFVNEIFMHAGDDLRISVLKMINHVFVKTTVPGEWRTIIIKMIFRGKGKRNQLKNWRGIFLTVTICKLFEKMTFERQGLHLESGFSEYAAGARKNRSTLDHLFVWQAINDYYRYLGVNILMVFLDLEKAFDKLWLKRCLLDLFKSGVKGKCLVTTYELNRCSNVTVQNDSGKSDIFNIGESVKQGTVWAAPICANFIDKGFREIEMAKTLAISYGNIKIPHLL